MAGSNLRFTPFQEIGRSRLLMGVPDCYLAFSAVDWVFPIPIVRSRLWIGRPRLWIRRSRFLLGVLGYGLGVLGYGLGVPENPAPMRGNVGAPPYFFQWIGHR